VQGYELHKVVRTGLVAVASVWSHFHLFARRGSFRRAEAGADTRLDRRTQPRDQLEMAISTWSRASGREFLVEGSWVHDFWFKV